MEKRSWKKRILRILLAVIGTPVIAMVLLVTLLYFPPVQRWVVDMACKEISAASGYDIEIGSISLDFPLKLRAKDFKVSRNDSIFLQGKRIDADIAMLPLFTGDLEINHFSLEDVDVHTYGMMDAARIDGRIGYARIVARDVDFSRSIANIRQLHIEEADLDITLPDTIPDDDSPMPQWIVKLHNGNIKNSRISLHVPGDSISTALHVEHMQVKDGCMDLIDESYAIEGFMLNASRLNYDRGNGTQEENPLDHIEFENIALCGRNLFYSEESIYADITDFTMEQPGGLDITRTTALLSSSNDTLRLHNLEIESRNGSRIHGEFTVPRQTMYIPIDKEFTAALSATLNKRDLVKFVTPQMYDNLAMFNNEMLDGHIELSGNIHNIEIDSIAIEFHGLGTVNAKGNIRNILKKERINGFVAFNGNVENIARIADPKNFGGYATIEGSIGYDKGRFEAQMAMRGTTGDIDLNASYDIEETCYGADIRIERLALADIMPDIPLHNLTMQLHAKGKGLDIFDNTTRYDIEASIDTLYYSDYRLRSLTANATQKDGISIIDIEGSDKELLINILATTRLNAAGIENHTTIELAHADFKGIGMTDAELKTSTNIDLVAASDLDKTHSLKVTGKGTRIITKEQTFTPDDLLLEFETSPRRTTVSVENGDLEAHGSMECGYTTLFTALDKVALMYDRLVAGTGRYGIMDFEKALPQMQLHLECGERNMLHNFLAYNGIEAGDINLDMAMSPQTGLELNGSINKFGNKDFKLDSILVTAGQKGNALDYFVGIDNLSITSLGEENSYSASLDGSIGNDTVTANLALRDNVKELDSRLGATAHLTPQKMSLCFDREALLFGTPFVFNDGNYIDIGKGMTIDADVLFHNSNECGFRLLAHHDATEGQDISLKIFNVELADIANSIPGMPQVAGNLLADISYRRNDSDRVACDIKVDSLAYNGNSIGNERIGVVYTSKTVDDANIDIKLSHNGSEVAHMNSDLNIADAALSNGRISLSRFPLDIANAFMGEDGATINGYFNGEISLSGTMENLLCNGYARMDSTYIYIPTLGATLHPSEENIMIENSLINFNRFQIYDKANSPFVINGTIGIAMPMDPEFNLQLAARGYEVLNTQRKPGKSLYGKMSVDLRSIISGTLNDLLMTGDVTILSNSDFAYVLPETAFETEKDLDGLVEFVNFNDTTETVHEELPEVDLGNITANFNIYIKEGAKSALDFDEAHENYIIFEGDGTLNATYDESGLNVTGIYKLNGGDLKLTLPIIPLKTFHIQEGGRLTWTGDLYNPTLDITALEKTTVSVEFEDNSIQPTTFYTGVVISNTVEEMGIDFTMSAPENAIVQEQLNKLDRETLSKYAVAMIITGTYLGGRQGVTATSALSSFLDAKINDISGEAIKNFDVNIGINDGLDAQTGSSYKNYSFSFSKRFFNDRITVVVGGEVNSGDRPDKDASNSSIINNVSLEWKLNDSGNRYMRIFYDKNYRSILEGEITETGIGYVYKRKLNKLKELFNFRKKKTRKKATDETTQKEESKR